MSLFKTTLKRGTAVLLAAAFTACMAGGCAAPGETDLTKKAEEQEEAEEKKLSVVTTIFPLYDWTKNITKGTNTDVVMLLDGSTDMHSYKPSAEDIIAIANCDIFIYVGGESDKWVDDAVKSAENKSFTSINLMDVMGSAAKEEEAVEGMEEDEEEEGAEEGPEYDEHIWLSLKNASSVIYSIEKALELADAENASTYKKNCSEYADRLKALDKEYESAVNGVKEEKRVLLFGDRFPFRYMADDYGITYYAAFKGCSAETEASFETIAFLAKKVDELSLKHVMTIEGTSHDIADTIIETTKAKDADVLSMNSMQGVDAAAVKNGADYIEIMEGNLDVLREALQ